jgi:hypothetical protein
MKSRRKFIRATSMLITSAGVMGYGVAHSAKRVLSINNGKCMIQHNVYFWIKDGVSESEKRSFERGIRNFVGSVKEVKRAEIGIAADTPARDVVDHSFSYSLFTWFANMEHHNMYQEHPAHKKFIEDFSAIWAKVQVYDSYLV